MQREENLKIGDRLRALRETQIGAFIPVLLALVAIWGYFGLVIPLQDLLTGETENFRAIFLTKRASRSLEGLSEAKKGFQKPRRDSRSPEDLREAHKDF